MELNLEEFGEGQDLQALADEAADGLEAASTAKAAPAGGQGSGDVDAEIVRLKARVEALERAENEHKDKHHRLLADFANHRNRVGRETQLAVTLAERKLLLEILPVMDSFERCVAATYASVEDFHNGVVLIHRQMQEALRKAGVEPVELQVGDPFDAQHAEALTTTAQPSLPDGSVAAIFERGYTHRDQLLRPARVVVNNHPDPDATAS
ncbi:nucleotide exchange factor GrpE [Mesoterricola sediminis]|nr:nucleotide exchange factor GrpE [Mesoterricola sediminis]